MQKLKQPGIPSAPWPSAREATIPGYKHMAAIKICLVCGEAYPESDGAVCRGCQGEAPYEPAECIASASTAAETESCAIKERRGQQDLHDMTRVEPAVFKIADYRRIS